MRVYGSQLGLTLLFSGGRGRWAAAAGAAAAAPQPPQPPAPQRQGMGSGMGMGWVVAWVGDAAVAPLRYSAAGADPCRAVWAGGEESPDVESWA